MSSREGMAGDRDGDEDGSEDEDDWAEETVCVADSLFVLCSRISLLSSVSPSPSPSPTPPPSLAVGPCVCVLSVVFRVDMELGLVMIVTGDQGIYPSLAAFA